MTRRLPGAVFLIAACAFIVPALPVHAAYPTDLPAALKEAKNLRVPAFVIVTKQKTTVPTAVNDPRVVRSTKAFACAAVPLTPSLAKQYELTGDAHVLLTDPDGTVVEKFDADVTAEKLLVAIKQQVAAARTELLKSLQPDSDAKAKKAALAGLARLGHSAENLIPLLIDSDATVKAVAKKSLTDLPPDATIDPLLAALKSDDAAIRAAVHPLAVQATNYKASPLKVWQTGTAEERTSAWEKWNEHVQTKFPPLNRAVLAYCEFSMGAQVNNGECAMLIVDAFKECKAKEMVPNGDTYIWGRALKPGEPVLPGDVVQFEGAKFTNGAIALHHTSVIRKVFAPGKYETLEQNVNGVKKVQPGKLDMATLKEGTVVIFRPQLK